MRTAKSGTVKFRASAPHPKSARVASARLAALTGTKAAEVPVPSVSAPPSPGPVTDEPLLRQVSRLKDLHALFTGMPVTLTLSPYGPAPLRLVCAARGDARAVDVYLPETLAGFAQQALQAWPHLRPPWRAWLDERPELFMEWTAGYMSAWKQVFARRGVMRVPEFAALPDDTPEQAAARLAGFEEFMKDLLHPDQGRAEGQGRPDLEAGGAEAA